jgi:hypothetical protein
VASQSSLTLPSKFRQLGDVARYAPRFIESQRVGDLGIARISVSIDIGEACPFAVLNPASNASTVHGGGKRLIAARRAASHAVTVPGLSVTSRSAARAACERDEGCQLKKP